MSIYDHRTLVGYILIPRGTERKSVRTGRSGPKLYRSLAHAKTGRMAALPWQATRDVGWGKERIVKLRALAKEYFAIVPVYVTDEDMENAVD